MECSGEELGLLCAALLISVPADTVHSIVPAADAAAGAWSAVARCVLDGVNVEASKWRLAMRLAGFALDRHLELPQAFAHLAIEEGLFCLQPPEGAMPGSDDDDDDEWAPADNVALRIVQDFLETLRKDQKKIHRLVPPAAA